MSMQSGLSAQQPPLLMGVEVGRSKVRIVTIDPADCSVSDVVERPIAKVGGPRDPIEQELSTRAAIEAALDQMGLGEGASLAVAATMGFPNCGVGSGPALRGWLQSLSVDLDEPMAMAGSRGVSYAPLRYVEFMQQVFASTGLKLDRIELAPVAAVRVTGRLRSAALTLGSGITWSARVLDSQVLEAFETTEGAIDDAVQVTLPGGAPTTPEVLDQITVDEFLCRNRGVQVAALAPAAGVALGLLDADPSNLLTGERIYGTQPDYAPGPVDDDVSGHDLLDATAAEHALDDVQLEAEAADPHPVVTVENHATRQLQRVPRSLQRSQEYPAITPDQIRHQSSLRREEPEAEPEPGPESHFDAIAAFAHPDGELKTESGFNWTDFLIGALAMTAVVLAYILSRIL
ncbi:MAG: hypothetical protein AAF467_11980 [Actinomycetota bacterium]